MAEPNFFLVGAPKAGTTSLYYQLRQHPEIYMSPIKEPCYFSMEVRPENFAPEYRERGVQIAEQTQAYLRGPMTETLSGGMVTTWPDYLRLFEAVNGQRAIGEATVGYLVSPYAAQAIAERVPHARILMVLRSPADRAFSQYLHVMSEGLVRESFREYVGACLRRGDEGLGVHKPFLEMGFYAAQVQRYLDHFPRQQVGLWIYEEHLAEPHRMLREIFGFLEVDANFDPDRSARYHQPRIPRAVAASGVLQWARETSFSRRLMPAAFRRRVRDVFYRAPGSVTMDADDRAMMLEFYRADILKLQGMLDRDLSAWLV